MGARSRSLASSGGLRLLLRRHGRNRRVEARLKRARVVCSFGWQPPRQRLAPTFVSESDTIKARSLFSQALRRQFVLNQYKRREKTCGASAWGLSSDLFLLAT